MRDNLTNLSHLCQTHFNLERGRLVRSNLQMTSLIPYSATMLQVNPFTYIDCQK